MKHDQKNPYVKLSLAGVCLTCQQPVVATCEGREKTIEEIRACIDRFDRNTLSPVAVEKIYPQIVAEYGHQSIPEKINDSFIDLQRMFITHMQPHLIISGCRSVLESSLDSLGAEGKTIYAKIENLYQKGIIPITIKDWAHIIRNIGNNAIHDMEGNREDAQNLINFTKIFLQYSFELPYTIKTMRNKKS